MSSLNKRLSEIQKILKVEKSQFNKFGGYNFRSTEDILEGVKPLLGDLTLKIDEDMVCLGTLEHRFYKKVTATISDGKESIAVTSYTREDDSQKGMSHSQLSGAVGSYGAKMALRGLFLIDDTRDADATNTHGKEDKPAPTKPVESPAKDVKAEPAPESFKRKPKTKPEAPKGSEEDDY